MEATDRWQQVEDIFHAALERAPSERAAFLDEACGSDVELRADVESIIAAHEAPGDFIDTPAYKITNSLFSSSIIESREGRVVGHYNIVGQLGRGGMGEVYLAEDTQLGRKVALKFLPASVTGDQSRLRRFEQEARAASALNHPNIVTIYEIGKAEGSHYISTELIEGDTLRRRLSRGRLDIRDAIDITIQLTSALAAAHQSGIVHRDIKPENIMLRPDGYVKILDFGLAKLTQKGGDSSEEMARRIVRVDTEPGVVMGTLSYMSPEQARGREVDGRSDIFSLGVVLYEMIAEQSPFAGDTPSDVIASILKVDPSPLSKFSHDMPAELQRIVNLALQKDKSKRYQSADQMLSELKNLKQDLEFEAKLSRTGGFMSSFLIKSTRRGLTPYLALSGLAIVLAIGGIIWWSLSGRSNTPETFLPSSLKLIPVADWKSVPLERPVSGTLSPDGKFVAFSSAKGGNTNIWVKQVNGGDPIQVTKGDWSDDSPVWSPDGEEIAFVSNRGGRRGIWSVPALGGTPKSIKELDVVINPNLRRWARDRKTIYYESVFNLFSLDLNTGNTNQLTHFDSSGPRATDLSLSWDESRIAYVQNKEGQNDIWVLNLEDGSTVKITNDPDLERKPVWLPDGKRIIYSANRGAIYQICLAFVEGGNPIQMTSGESDSWVQDISRDSTKILYTSTNEEGDLWEVDVNKAQERELTSDAGVELWPDISPDGSMIAYQAVRDPSNGMRLLEGSIVVRQLNSTNERVQQVFNGFDPRWSTDGKKLTFLRSSGGLFNLWMIDALGGKEIQLTDKGISITGFAQLPYNRTQIRDFSWSPSEDKITYCSRQQELSNIYVLSLNGLETTMVSNNVDKGVRFTSPLWSPDGLGLAALLSPYSLASSSSGSTESIWEVWLKEGDQSRILYKTPMTMRLIGWSPSGNGLIAASVEKNQSTSLPEKVRLFQIPLDGSDARYVDEIESTYFHNIQLSPDGRHIALVSRAEGRDNVFVIPVAGGQARKVTSNTDPRLYFSSLIWSPDGKNIYYGRQTRRSLVSMLDNFK